MKTNKIKYMVITDLPMPEVHNQIFHPKNRDRRDVRRFIPIDQDQVEREEKDGL